MALTWRLFVGVFFLLVLTLGMSVYRDYGLSWDEQGNRRNGAVSAVYVNAKLGNILMSEEGVQRKLNRVRRGLVVDSLPSDTSSGVAYDAGSLRTYKARDYGVAFELVLIGLEAVLQLDDPRSVYLMRHLSTFVFFWVGLVLFYLVLVARYAEWTTALVGCLMLLLSPRIFAHAFYNSKDLVFLSATIVAMFTMQAYLGRRSPGRALLHALACGFLIAVRVAGVLMPAVTVLVCLCDDMGRDGRRSRLLGTLGSVLFFLTLTAAVSVGLWPYLWEHPLRNLGAALATMSRFNWNGYVFYLGEFRRAPALPWHYPLTWMLVTTPIAYLLAAAVGLVGWLSRLGGPRDRIADSGEGPSPGVRNTTPAGWFLQRLDPEQRRLMDWAVLLLLVGPLVAVIALDSVLYDGWRHLFFVYPPLLYFAAAGIDWFRRWLGASGVFLRPAMRWTVAGGICAAMFAPPAVFIASSHPHQQVFFNTLVRDPERHFERDYWGLSYRKGLEYLLDRDGRPTVKVCVANTPGRLNALMLPEEERQRLRFVASDEADYYLTNFRYDRGGRAQQAEEAELLENAEALGEIRVGRVQILGIYSLARPRQESISERAK